jgi:hypothetical protein
MAKRDMIDRLIQAAIDTLHHDTDGGDAVDKYERDVLRKNFGAILEPTAMREALDNSQSLLVAMLNEQRPAAEIEQQIAENRTALTPGFFEVG